MNQYTNVQLNLQEYNSNTYVVERSSWNNVSNYEQKVYNPRFEQDTLKCNCKQQKEAQCNCMKEKYGEHGKMECCCPIGNPKVREEYEIVIPEFLEKCKRMKKCNCKKIKIVK